jgi:hypothetical protein
MLLWWKLHHWHKAKLTFQVCVSSYKVTPFQFGFYVIETPIMGPFISQIASSICFRLCLKGVTFSQQSTQDHQWKLYVLHLIFICCNIIEKCRNGSWSYNFSNLGTLFLKGICFSKVSSSYNLTKIHFKILECSTSQCFFMAQVSFFVL